MTLAEDSGRSPRCLTGTRRVNHLAMGHRPDPGPPRPGVVAVFTVGSALRWLGHECGGRRCSRPLDALPGSIWFLLPRAGGWWLAPRTRVLIETPSTGALPSILDRMIIDVIWCARGDGIQIGRRSPRGGELPDRPIGSSPPTWPSRPVPAGLDTCGNPTEIDLATLAAATLP